MGSSLLCRPGQLVWTLTPSLLFLGYECSWCPVAPGSVDTQKPDQCPLNQRIGWKEQQDTARGSISFMGSLASVSTLASLALYPHCGFQDLDPADCRLGPIPTGIKGESEGRLLATWYTNTHLQVLKTCQHFSNSFSTSRIGAHTSSSTPHLPPSHAQVLGTY